MRLTTRSMLAALYGGERLNGAAEESTARAFHVQLICLLSWVLLIMVVDVPFFAVRKLAVTLLFAAVGGTVLGSLYLLRRGRLRLASIIFVSTVWLLAEVSVELSGGLANPGYVLLPLIVVNAGWLLGRMGALALAAATVVLTAADLALRYAGHAPPLYFPGNPTVAGFTFIAILILTLSPLLLILNKQRQQVSALRESEGRFRSLSDAALEGIMIHDGGVILDCNLAFARMFGYEPEELMGRDGPELLLDGESRARIRERIERRGSGVVEVTCVRKDGARFPAETESRTIRFAGRDARLVAMHDITELKRAIKAHREIEESLRENELRLEEAQEMARVGSYTSDALTGGMEWSRELFRIYEMEPSGTAPAREAVLARIHPDDRARVREAVRDARLRQGPFDYEYRLVLPDGRMKFVLVRGTVGPGADGGIRARGTVQDITERKLAEQQEAKLERELHQAQRMESIGLLAGGVAHDFNNMLTVILGYAALLKRAFPSDAPQLKHVTEIVNAATRSKEITQQLLSFARRQVITPVPANLNDLVADLREPFARLIGEDIELTFRPLKDLWKIVVDPAQVNQILLNLVVNARDAMPGGGKLMIETANVTVTGEFCRTEPGAKPGLYVLLTVRDTGAGMSAETAARIFEPFFTTKGHDKGTGLGLATVYGIVKQNGGFIKVDTAEGAGTAFRIYLPRMAGEPVTEDAVAEADGVTILVVDDDELVREVARFAVESLGYAVLVATNAEQALDLCGQSGASIQLVLSDVVMPGMNGMELRERLMAIYPAIKVVLMSGFAPNSILNHGALQGVHFIQKPFSPEVLQKRLEEVLSGTGRRSGSGEECLRGEDSE